MQLGSIALHSLLGSKQDDSRTEQLNVHPLILPATCEAQDSRVEAAVLWAHKFFLAEGTLPGGGL